MKYIEKSNDKIRIGLLIPYHGPLGMLGLSSEKCANLAAAELNSYKGILGQEIELIHIEASGNPNDVAQKTEKMINQCDIKALVGMHTSDIRVALIEKIQSKIPFIYTPMYEGGEASIGAFMTGDTSYNSITTMTHWLSKNIKSDRWCFIGNDYLWPRTTNKIARDIIQKYGKELLSEVYVPFHQSDFTPYLQMIEKLAPDILFLSLIGDSSVLFNRKFGKMGLSDHISRYCCAADENLLYAIGAENTKNLYSTVNYYQDLKTSEAQGFSKLYNASFGEQAPVINHFATSCYDGMMLLSNLAERAGSLDCLKLEQAAEKGLEFSSPRGTIQMENKHIVSKPHVVGANGLHFKGK